MRQKINIGPYRDCRNRADKEAPCVIKLRVYTDGRTRHLPLVRSNGETPRMTKKDYDACMSKRPPARLQPARRFFDSEVLRARSIIDKMPVYNWEQLKAQFTGAVAGSLTADMEQAASRKKTATQLTYRAALRRLAGFLGKEAVQYADLTPVVVERFVFSMEDAGLSADTIKTYMAAIKYIVTQARKKKIVPGDYDPFTVYTPPRGVKRQLQLTVNQFRAVMEYRSDDYEKQFARDTFIFGTLCNGQYTATIYRLRKDQILGNWLTFVREKTKDKTGQGLEAYVTPTMREIIERYEATAGLYIFPVLTGRPEAEHFNAVSAARHKANRNLKEIAAEINAANPLLKMPAFTVKYCRGTYYRVAQEVGGLSAEQARLTAGHSVPGMMGHYDRGFSREEQEAALKKIG